MKKKETVFNLCGEEIKTPGAALLAYSAGKCDTIAINAMLEGFGSNVRIVPDQNELTEENKRESTVGYYPEQANGWGILDDGIGLSKIKVVNGTTPTLDMGEGLAYVYMCGRRFKLNRTKLEDIPGEYVGE